MTQLLWIRHLPIEITGRYTGHSDIEAIIPINPLTEQFPENALCFSSPLKRAISTAKWLGVTDPIIVDALKEQHFGTWEGQYYDEVWKEAEHLYDWSKPEQITPPEGESFADLCERVDSWLNPFLVEHSGQPIVVVAHAGVIRAGLRHALHLSLPETLAIQVDYASITQITYNEKGATADYVNCRLGVTPE